MSRIGQTFSRLKKQNRAAFIPFIMAGDPNLAKTPTLLDALVQAGADIIELGMPFSDPMADGPVIEAAGLRALKNGTTIAKVLALAAQFRKKHATPLVLMGYLNPIAHYGYAKFAHDAAKAGVDGIIIVDLPPEESPIVEPLLKKHHLALIRLIAPTSVPSRLKLLTKGAEGYLYYISMTGVTGAKATSATSISKQLAAIRKYTTLPIAVGFGIKTPQDVKAFAKHADAVIVGSALVTAIERTRADAGKLKLVAATLANACAR